MTVDEEINQELAFRKLLPLNPDQVSCLHDPARLSEAADMLADLRDRCQIRLPLLRGMELGGPFHDEDSAREAGYARRSAFSVVVVDAMATDESRSSGTGNEYYVTGYTGPEAAVALATLADSVAVWVNGEEHSPA